MCTVTAVRMTKTSQSKQQGAGSFGSRVVTAFIPLLHKPYASHKPRVSTSSSSHYVLPINYFFTLCPYEMLFFWGQDAQRVFLASPGLSVDYIGALVHVDCSLR